MLKPQNNRPKRVIVYQMGRVGSRSMVDAIEDCGFDIVHVHRLSLNELEVPITFFEAARRFRRRQIFRLEPLFGTKKIISLFRDPLKRNISSFFYNLELFTKDIEIKSVFDLHDLFLAQSQILRTSETWFNEELKKFTGVDIFSEPFDKVRGYQIIKGNLFDVFVGRTDKINGLEQELGDFLNCSGVNIIKSNDIAKSSKSHLYAEFLETFRAPDWLIKDLYNGETCRHFFTEGEIQEMVAHARDLKIK